MAISGALTAAMVPIVLAQRLLRGTPAEAYLRGPTQADRIESAHRLEAARHRVEEETRAQIDLTVRELAHVGAVQRAAQLDR